MNPGPGGDPVYLVCLDVDGTFMMYDEGKAFIDPLVVHALNRLEHLGIPWCINSGRDLESQLQILGLVHEPVAWVVPQMLSAKHRAWFAG